MSQRTIALLWLLAAVLVGLATVPLAHAVLRRSRQRRAGDPRRQAHVAWLEVVSDAYDVGHRLPPSDSPRGAAMRLVRAAHLDGPAAAALQRVVRAEEHARYAPVGSGPTPAGGSERPSPLADAALVSAALFRTAPGAVRLRARLLPPSTVRAVTSTVGEWTADLLDRLDRLRERLVRAVLSALARATARSGRSA